MHAFHIVHEEVDGVRAPLGVQDAFTPRDALGHASVRFERDPANLVAEQVVLDPEQLARYRNDLPVFGQRDYRYEQFHFLFLSWDVVAALYLLERYPRPVAALTVASAAQAYGLNKPYHEPETLPNGHIRLWSGLVAIDPQLAMGEEIAVEKPVVLVQRDIPGEEDLTILIDGMHRLYRAAQEGKETIPCFMLSKCEEFLCRL